jgi:multiple sugar transport system permease protein/raffinose/stachyose/melibiose transport system permease protein
MYLIKDGDNFRKGVTPWLFLALPLIIYVVMLAYPLIRSIFLSFTKWSGMGGGPSFIGLANYRHLISHGTLSLAIKNNLIWLALSVPVPTFLGFALALFLRERTRMNVLLRSLFYIPMILSNAVIAVMWMHVYEPTHGLLTEILGFLHLPTLTRSFLTRPGTAIVAISIVGIWHWIGFPLVIYLAAIQDIPADLLDAADLDGATPFQKVIYIIIPLVRHATTIVIALGAIMAMKVFDLVFLLTGGYYKNDVLGTLIWRIGFDQYHIGRASAVAVIDFLIIAAIVIPYIAWQWKSGDIEL